MSHLNAQRMSVQITATADSCDTRYVCGMIGAFLFTRCEIEFTWELTQSLLFSEKLLGLNRLWSVV